MKRREWMNLKKAHSRSGSTAVFLCVVMAALVSVCFAMIWSTLAYTNASRADAVMNLVGDSLLSEYDRSIQEDYGLFMIHESDRELSAKLRKYLLYTFDRDSGVSVSGIHASGGSLPASDPAAMRMQILDHMKNGGMVSLTEPAAETGSGESDDSSAGSDAGHVLRHGPTIASLPSRQLPAQSLAAKAAAAGERLSDLESCFQDGTDRYLLGSYILGTFNCDGSLRSSDHFFLREAEYILCGGLSDRENRKRVSAALKALRFPSNLAHIYSDPEKRNALAAAAEIISPGLGAPAAQALLASAWAYAESANDVRLLLRGFRVPLIKDGSGWAVDLEHVLEDPDDDGVIHPDIDQGLTYRQYLRMLLFIENEDMLTARILDLIQINMRKNNDGGFLIGECSLGVTIESIIDRREYRYEKLYQGLLYP